MTRKPLSINIIKENIIQWRSLQIEQLREIQNAKDIFFQFCDHLNRGEIRSAEKNKEGMWQANIWVKEGILIGMRLGVTIPVSSFGEALHFFDKDTLPLQQIDGVKRNIRVVPGGTSIRNGVYIGESVVCMPPCYINIGAYVGKGTMIDSHATVGSCAQVGEYCHISAGAQIGGVLEPVNANPCIVEDDVLMGINTAIAEGVILRRGVVLGVGVHITASTPVYDLVHKVVYTSKNGPLTIPENAVVIPGIRLVRNNTFAESHGIGIAAPVIKKYRDDRTDAKTALEEALR